MTEKSYRSLPRPYSVYCAEFEGGRYVIGAFNCFVEDIMKCQGTLCKCIVNTSIYPCDDLFEAGSNQEKLLCLINTRFTFRMIKVVKVVVLGSYATVKNCVWHRYFFFNQWSKNCKPYYVYHCRRHISEANIICHLQLSEPAEDRPEYKLSPESDRIVLFYGPKLGREIGISAQWFGEHLPITAFTDEQWDAIATEKAREVEKAKQEKEELLAKIDNDGDGNSLIPEICSYCNKGGHSTKDCPLRSEYSYSKRSACMAEERQVFGADDAHLLDNQNNQDDEDW